MKTERQREAAELRAEGAQRAQEIRSKAERDATVIVAEANQQAEQTRGEGDAERNRIFAEAYGQDPDFFAFYRSMNAYETGLRSNDTRFLLRPDSRLLPLFRRPERESESPGRAIAAGDLLRSQRTQPRRPDGVDCHQRHRGRRRPRLFH